MSISRVLAGAVVLVVVGCSGGDDGGSSPCLPSSFTLTDGTAGPVITADYFPCGAIDSDSTPGKLIFAGQGRDPTLGLAGVESGAAAAIDLGATASMTTYTIGGVVEVSLLNDNPSDLYTSGYCSGTGTITVTVATPDQVAGSYAVSCMEDVGQTAGFTTVTGTFSVGG